MLRSSLRFLLLGVLPALPAQKVAVGLTYGPSGNSPYVYQQMVGLTGGCLTLGRCQDQNNKPPMSHDGGKGYAGGTAYDGRNDAVWTTVGGSIELIQVSKVGSLSCAYVCGPIRTPGPPLSSRAPMGTGLTYVASGPLGGTSKTGWLFISLVDGYVGRLTPNVASGSCSFGAEWCKFSVQSGKTIAGLASDASKRLLFIAESAFGSTAPGNVIYVTNMDKAWCTPICSFQVPTCRDPSGKVITLGPVTGLAYDPCAVSLYITDGKYVMHGFFGLSGTQCSFNAFSCCPAPPELYAGLAMMPTQTKSVGSSCTASSCNSCPGMRAGTVGQPVLGNSSFALNLTGAPSNFTIAVMAIGIGPCNATGVGIGFCDTVKVSLVPPLIFFFGAVPSIGGCTASIEVPGAIPLAPAACNKPISVQWLVECKGTPTGNGITNCLTIEISGG